ncbi:MAG: cobalamin biosynthesis protein CobQ [Verrucomicrobiaceae bacterium]|nr:cobalamin biosynthesis protein CobQ [Verrucomicrobiaceae bacterium]
MRIWSVANQKGGVGKTTTTVALAGLLAERGARVLLVDLDPHGSLTSYFGYNPETVEHSTFALFAEHMISAREQVQALLIPARDTGIQMLAASPALATVERRSLSGTGVRISKALALLWDDFDYALIDTPPVLGALMVNALAACEKLLIPVQTEFLALKGLERMLRTLEMLARSQQKALPYLIIPTLFDRRTHASVSSLRTLRNDYPERIWAGMIPVDTRFRDASRVGLLPSRLDAQSRGVEAYRSLLKILLSVDNAPAAMKSSTALR